MSWWNSAANGWSAQAALPGLAAQGSTALLLLLGLAMIGPLFSQTAWNNVTFTGAEVREPGRTLPRAMILGAYIDHIYDSREGSRGATGTAGGGCGCN